MSITQPNAQPSSLQPDPSSVPPTVKRDGVERHDDGKVTFIVGAARYTIPPANKEHIIEDNLAIDAELRKTRKGPIEAILPELQRLAAFPDIQQGLLDRAYHDLRKGAKEEHVSQDDIRTWIDTLPGLLFTMGLIFRRYYPALTDGDILEIIMKVGDGEMLKAREKLQEPALRQVMGDAKYDAL
jgi:hypothetical protein